VGDLFAALEPRLSEGEIGVVGLGIGSLAWYAKSNQKWTFFEIDPAVNRLAHNAAYFRYLKECRAQKLDVQLGDGRLQLQEIPDRSYDLLVLDAFSSDSIPLHLLTREALQLYLAKLKPNGVLAFHISNRYLDLKPVLADLAADARLHCRCRDDLTLDPEDAGKDPSQWAVMARSPADLGDLAIDSRWKVLEGNAQAQLWRDDYFSILSIVRWNESPDP
jgi:hypothetical protein